MNAAAIDPTGIRLPIDQATSENPEFSRLLHLLIVLFDSVMKRATPAAPKKASMSYRRHRHPRP
jgi:hypothetical protein